MLNGPLWTSNSIILFILEYDAKEKVELPLVESLQLLSLKKNSETRLTPLMTELQNFESSQYLKGS